MKYNIRQILQECRKKRFGLRIQSCPHMELITRKACHCL